MPHPETVALEKSFNRLTEDSDTSLLLMNIEDRLREKGDVALSDRLTKLEVDISAYYAGAEDDKKGTPLTQPFIDGYEKLTIPRMNAIMNDVETALKGDPLAADFAVLAKDVRALLEAPNYTKQRPAAASIKPM